jgi:predicted nuclease of predicted toxin-antitoxin system
MSPGITDDAVLTQSQNAAQILITADKDFGDLVLRRQQTSPGVLLIRLWGLTPLTKAAVVAAAIRDHGNELTGAFSVLTSGGI